MKKQRIVELAVKVLVAALTAFLTAIGTTLHGARPHLDLNELGLAFAGPIFL